MTGKPPFLDAGWRAIFLARGLVDFTAWWALTKDPHVATLIDDPNIRYGGESNVYRVMLNDSQGRECTLYVKCQLDQWRRTWRRPLHGEPTVCAEFRALQWCLAKGIPVARPLFFDSGEGPDGRRYTVLVSLGLDGFDSLADCDIAALDAVRRQRLMADVAETLAFMHGCRYLHRNLYPKHVFVAWRPALGRFDVRFIDLEKARPVIRQRACFRDLETLARRTMGVDIRDQLRFLRHYLGQARLDGKGKLLARRLAEAIRLRPLVK